MFDTAFTVWGASVTWLEVAAFALALGCVVFNILEIHWAWPLAIASSLLYCRLFFDNRLYGDAGLQVFFALIALWGWWQWLFGKRGVPAAGGEPEPLAVATLGPAARAWLVALWLAGWGVLGLLLDAATDTDVPYFDAFPTAGSVLGQILLGRKFIENWWVWVVVNVVAVALFAYKALWLTALLYVLFVGLAVIGYLRWRRVLVARSPAAQPTAVA